MRMHEINDLYFSEAGDFFVDDNGDLRDTKFDAYRGLIQRVDTRILSSRGDWAPEPGVGANLSDFLGKKNNARIGQAIKERIENELRQEDLLRAGEFAVDVVPIASEQIAILVIITPPGITGQITRLFSYSLRDNKIYLRSL
jgi:hypothetical protein